jgi:hypothetical protein
MNAFTGWEVMPSATPDPGAEAGTDVGADVGALVGGAVVGLVGLVWAAGACVVVVLCEAELEGDELQPASTRAVSTTSVGSDSFQPARRGWDLGIGGVPFQSEA